MPLPRWSTMHYDQGSDEQKIMTYYNAQIHLRKILNRAHSALYNSGSKFGSPSKQERKTLTFAPRRVAQEPGLDHFHGRRPRSVPVGVEE